MRLNRTILAGAVLAAAGALGAPVAAPAAPSFPSLLPAPQQPPKPPTPQQSEEREKKAQALWDDSEKLEKEGKLPEAQAKLRELRNRFRSTRVYFDKMEQISERINALGLQLAVAALQKTAIYKKPHQDSWFGYEYSPPDGWKGVPPMAGYAGEQDNEEAYLKGRVERVSRYTAPYLDRLYLSVYKVYDCDNLAYLESKLLEYLDRSFKGLKEEAKAPWQGAKGVGLRKTYTTAAGDRIVAYYFFAERRGLCLWGVWRAGNEENFTMTITTVGPDGATTVRKSSSDKPVSPEDFAHAAKIFDQVGRSFWIYDAGTRNGMAAKLQRRALGADWNLMKSSKGSYLIEYATTPEYAKRCGDELEQILALYRQVIPTGKGFPVCRVKVFDREDDMMYYSGAYGAAAYWSPAQEEIVCYKFEGDKVKLDSKEEFTIAEERAPEEVTFKILYHEAFHQYIYFLVGKGRMADIPSWLNEGLGDYFFGGDWDKKTRKFSIGVNDWRIKRIHDAVKEDKHVAWERIVRYNQMAYYADPGLCYAQGWSMNYFLLTSPVARAKGWSAIPTRMIDAIKASGDGQKATDKVFQGMDLKAMEAEWKKFVLAIPIPKHLMNQGGAND